MAGGIVARRRQPASLPSAGSARKMPEGPFGEGSFAQLRRDNAAQRWNAAAHAAEHHGGARRSRTYRADSRVDAGRYGAEDLSIATAAGKGFQSENPEHDAEHDSGAGYGRTDQLREPAVVSSGLPRRPSLRTPAGRLSGGLAPRRI